MKNKSGRRLVLHKETLRALAVKTGVKTGISGSPCTTKTVLTVDPIRACTAACD